MMNPALVCEECHNLSRELWYKTVPIPGEDGHRHIRVCRACKGLVA